MSIRRSFQLIAMPSIRIAVWGRSKRPLSGRSKRDMFAVKRRSIRRATKLLWGVAGLLVCSLTGLASMNVQAQYVLRIARIADAPDQEVGSDILAVVYAKLGLHVEFVDVPAKRSLIESSSGRLDGEVQRVLDVQREYPTLVAVKEPFNYIEPTAFENRLASNFNVNGWESLRSCRIGIVRGVGSSERGTAGMPQVIAVATMDQMMLMLARGRIDVAVNDIFSGTVIINRLGLTSQLRAVFPPLERIDMYHFLNERNREIVPRVEAVIREMRDSGELQQLRSEITHRMFEESLGGPLSARP